MPEIRVPGATPTLPVLISVWTPLNETSVPPWILKSEQTPRGTEMGTKMEVGCELGCEEGCEVGSVTVLVGATEGAAVCALAGMLQLRSRAAIARTMLNIMVPMVISRLQ